MTRRLSGATAREAAVDAGSNGPRANDRAVDEKSGSVAETIGRVGACLDGARRDERVVGAIGRTAAPLSSPKVDRAVRRAETAREVARSLDRHGTVRSVVAPTIGVRRQLLDDVCDPEGTKTLSVADMRALPPAVRLDLLRWCASEIGHGVHELPLADGDLADDLALVARVQTETSQAVSAHLALIAKRSIDRREAVEAVREIDEAIAALMTAREAMNRVVNSGARVVRTGGPAKNDR